MHWWLVISPHKGPVMRRLYVFFVLGLGKLLKKQSTCNMMTSSNGNIFRVTGHLCGEFPTQRPVTRSFDVFFDLHPNKRLRKQSWGWWFETLSCSLWHHCNEMIWDSITLMVSYNVFKNGNLLTPNIFFQQVFDTWASCWRSCRLANDLRLHNAYGKL